MPASMAVEAVYLNPTRASPETHMCCFHSNSLRLLQHIGGHFELESAVLILAKAAVEASASGTSKYAAMVPDALAKLEESTLFIATTAKGEPLLEAPLGAGVDSVNGWLAEEANGGGGVVAFTSPSRAHKAISCASNEARERWGQCRLSAVKGGEFLRGIIEGGASPVVVFDVYVTGKTKRLQPSSTRSTHCLVPLLLSSHLPHAAIRMGQLLNYSEMPKTYGGRPVYWH